MSGDLWQTDTLQALNSFLYADEKVQAFAVMGSMLSAAPLDQWGDLDVLVVVQENARTRFEGVEWLRFLGTPYAVEQHEDQFRALTRVIFQDLRHVDVTVTTEKALGRIHQWARVPFWSGIQVLFSRSAATSAVLDQTFRQPQPILPTAEQFNTMVDQFWFRGVMAVKKIARGDHIVGLHLALEMVQDCLMLAMLHRDRATGSTYHRSGGKWNVTADTLIPTYSTQMPPLDILTMIERSAALFDDLARQWSPQYRDRRHPLLALIEQARAKC